MLTSSRVSDLLASRAEAATSAPVAPAMTITAPSLTTPEATAVIGRMTKISTWTTWFPISERNHFGANIWIPAMDIDGTVVDPGDDIRLLEGRRDRSLVPTANGDGGAIINGKTEPQGALAGGICSSSTTLFNAVLRAGFKMGARRNHFYFIDRYPAGLDATVFKSGSGSTQTMSWTNDTAYPVLIRGYKIRSGGKGFVRYDIYSVPTGRKVVIGNPTIKNIRPAFDTVQYTTSMRSGTSKRIEFPVDGKDVWRTVTVYQNGKIIHQTTYYSHYARITGVTLIGRLSAFRPGLSGPRRPRPAPGAASLRSVRLAIADASPHVGQYQRASSGVPQRSCRSGWPCSSRRAPQSASSRSADARSRPSPVSEYSIRGGRME